MNNGFNRRRRNAISGLAYLLCVLATIIALIPLMLILFYVIRQGAPAMNLDFLTQLPKPVGETGGGMGNAIVGSLMLIGIAAVIGLPLGVLAGTYLAEFRSPRLSWTVRLLADILSGVPSIIIGVFVYTLLVLTMKHFSALAGGVALAILMLPTVARTTEEMLRMVPDTLREASLALGISRWRTIVSIIIKTAGGGIMTGIMLALARIAGETAPLLFTALSSRTWPTGLDKPVASLPVQIYTYAISPYEDWHQQAWAGSLVLVIMVLLLSVGSKLYFGRKMRSVR
ncbi:MAG: phosphate ABC transporter permease PstA [Actinobacteria bacterium]|nr:phosphate ABC transporter permease PstA [Actinomycetota bacterium]MCL5882988.1 phosphate ABC transporter permease PstA [Actinomycetota bacterium]